MRNRRHIAIIVFLLAAYVGSYCFMSVCGRYEPFIIGLNGVKAYTWAPSSFVKDFKWNRILMAFYFPLYVIDIKLVHNLSREYEAREKGYPINEVPAEKIGNVYRAWAR